MRVVIRNVTSRQEEQVVLECVAFTPEFEDIRITAYPRKNH